MLANPLVYHPSTHARVLDEARNPAEENPYDRPINVPPELLNGSDFVPVTDRYVGIGDCTALFCLGGLFEKHARDARVRLASKVDFNDLRDSVSVLIGAYTNRWSTELSREAPLRFSMCSDKPCIVDSAQKKQWVVGDNGATGVSNEYYILISRLPHSKTGGFVLIGAGNHALRNGRGRPHSFRFRSADADPAVGGPGLEGAESADGALFQSAGYHTDATTTGGFSCLVTHAIDA